MNVNFFLLNVIKQVAMVCFVFATVFEPLVSWSDGMDQKTHTLLIEKLENAQKGISNQSKEWQSVTLRLADLYADRARLQFIAKNEKKCDTCPDGKNDRELAVSSYRKVLPFLPNDQKGETLLQISHLLQILSKDKQALETLKVIFSNKSYSAGVVARAHNQAGDIFYKQNKFSLAESHYKIAIRSEDLPNPGMTWYRLSWSELNQDKVKEATTHLIHILTSSELLEIKNQDGNQFDHSFHEDVSRDLVIFMARGATVDSEATAKKQTDQLVQLTPEELRRENLRLFATELERLGKKKTALIVWRVYQEIVIAELPVEKAGVENLEVQIHLAQLQWDLRQKRDSLNEFSQAMELWQKKGCKLENCTELEKRSKNFVITWHKLEKTKPSAEVLQAYKIYLHAFNQDGDMTIRAAAVAEQQKKFKDATELYAQSANLFHQRLKKGDVSAQSLLENSLLKQIESAEVTRDKQIRLSSYDHYLTLNGQGKKVVEVRYQKGQVLNEMGQTLAAYEIFIALALENKSDHHSLRLKSADLALDALAQLKDDGSIYEKSKQLSAFYPERKKEYQLLQVQAAIRLAAHVLNLKESPSDAVLQKEYDRLSQLPLQNVSLENRVLVYHNRLSLAERRKDLEGVEQTAELMLQIKKIKDKDREFALERLVWVAEMKLDFLAAFQSAKKMSQPQLSPVLRLLRLAMLSELAGNDPSPYYQKALTQSRDSKQKLQIRMALVRVSKRPWQEFKKQAPELQKNRDLMGRILLDVYARKGQDKEATQIINKYNLNKSSLNIILSQNDFISKWKKSDRRLSQHQLRGQSESLMKQTIQSRLQLIGEQEKFGKQAVLQSYWLGQFVVISTLAREYGRLSGDLLTLPIPRRLKGPIKIQYQNMVAVQAEKFKQDSDRTKEKLNQFYSNSQAAEEIKTAYRDSNGNVRTLLSEQIKILIKLFEHQSELRDLKKVLTEEKKSPRSEELLRVRNKLRKSPFDEELIKEYKDLAEQSGNVTLVAFLDQRLQQFKMTGLSP